MEIREAGASNVFTTATLEVAQVNVIRRRFPWLSVLVPTDAWMLGPAHKRLGELYEARGDNARAVSHYTAFVNLWKRADPDLQPRVAEVRTRLERLRRALPR